MTRDSFSQGEAVMLRPEGSLVRGYVAQRGARARIRSTAGSIDSVDVVWTCPLRRDPRSMMTQNDGDYPAADFVSICPRKATA